MGAAPTPRAPRQVTRLAMAAALVTVAAALVLLVVWAQRDRQSTLSRWQGRLGAIADDRRRTVEVWMQERLRDARTVAAHPDVQALAALHAAGSSGDPEPSKAVRGLVTQVASTYDNEAVW